MIRDKLYIGGEWVTPNSKEFIEVENPANKNIIGKVPSGDSHDVDKAVKAAKEAFATWQFSSLEERMKALKSIHDSLLPKVDLMSETISKELGCGVSFAKKMHVLPYLKDINDYLDMVKDFVFEERFEEFIIVKEPIGVVGALTPWNYPLGQIMKKISPCILSGSTMVLKPSQKTPLVAFILMDAIDESCLPKGVINLVSGKGSKVGNEIAKHKDINLITFTGSTKGGIEIAELAVSDMKRLSLELGGKSPAIILESADLDIALKKTLDKVYLNTGQSCSAYSRLFVPSSLKEKVEGLIIEKTKEYDFGNPLEGSNIGPVANSDQFEKVSYYINRGIEEGAKLLIGEKPVESSGYFIGPTVFTDVDNRMEIAQNEIFGPVLCIIEYGNLDEATEMANDTQFGLSGGVFGAPEDAYKVARAIRTGTIVINDGNQLHKAPFGGFKHSGVGREGGKYGLDEFLEIKTLFI